MPAQVSAVDFYRGVAVILALKGALACSTIDELGGGSHGARAHRREGLLSRQQAGPEGSQACEPGKDPTHSWFLRLDFFCLVTAKEPANEITPQPWIW